MVPSIQRAILLLEQTVPFRKGCITPSKVKCRKYGHIVPWCLIRRQTFSQLNHVRSSLNIQDTFQVIYRHDLLYERWPPPSSLQSRTLMSDLHQTFRIPSWSSTNMIYDVTYELMNTSSKPTCNKKLTLSPKSQMKPVSLIMMDLHQTFRISTWSSTNNQHDLMIAKLYQHSSGLPVAYYK